MQDVPADSTRTSLGELGRLFLKLGIIGFGGPAAHIALMEDEVVHRRRWLTREQFIDYVGATNLIPGPNSTELAIQIGRDRAGWAGLLVAGVSFIAPAAIIVAVLAWAYTRFGRLPEVASVLAGVKAVVIAIVVQALWRLGRTAVKSPWLSVLAVASAIAIIVGVHELVVLLVAGGVAGVAVWARTKGPVRPAPMIAPLALAGSSSATITALGAGNASGTTAASVSLLPLFGIFLKIGSVIFGSGYVLLAFLRADLVERLGWLTERQLLDAVAVGQITPGPVFTTATFIGYLLSGAGGAAVATLGIFLPAFVFVALSGPLVPRIRASRVAGAALDAVNVASLAMMAVVTWQLARAAIVDVPTAVLAVAAALLLLTGRMSSAWLVLVGAVAGLVITWL